MGSAGQTAPPVSLDHLSAKIGHTLGRPLHPSYFAVALLDEVAARRFVVLGAAPEALGRAMSNSILHHLEAGATVFEAKARLRPHRNMLHGLWYVIPSADRWHGVQGQGRDWMWMRYWMRKMDQRYHWSSMLCPTVAAAKVDE